jgi:uncharacterized damage-inducible protein DinB
MKDTHVLSKTMFLTTFEFNHVTNNRLLDIATVLTPEQWSTPLDAGQRSLHETFFHFLTVEEEWIYLCQNKQSRFRYRPIEDYPDVASLRAFSDQDYRVTCDYLAALDDDLLTSTVAGVMPPPEFETRTFPIWQILTHILYHSAQHRSEVALMLTRCGHSPGFIDFIGHVW